MPQKLLKTTNKTYSDYELAQYINNQKGTHFSSIIEAAAGLGLSIAGISGLIANPLGASIASGIGVAVAANAVLDAVIEAIDDSDLESTVGRMVKGDSLKVTTKFYEYTSNSQGNIVYYSKISYKIV